MTQQIPEKRQHDRLLTRCEALVADHYGQTAAISVDERKGLYEAIVWNEWGVEILLCPPKKTKEAALKILLASLREDKPVQTDTAKLIRELRETLYHCGVEGVARLEDLRDLHANDLYVDGSESNTIWALHGKCAEWIDQLDDYAHDIVDLASEGNASYGYQDAVSEMLADSKGVAEEVGCTREVVEAWCQCARAAVPR